MWSEFLQGHQKATAVGLATGPHEAADSCVPPPADAGQTHRTALRMEFWSGHGSSCHIAPRLLLLALQSLAGSEGPFQLLQEQVAALRGVLVVALTVLGLIVTLQVVLFQH